MDHDTAQCLYICVALRVRTGAACQAVKNGSLSYRPRTFSSAWDLGHTGWMVAKELASVSISNFRGMLDFFREIFEKSN